MGKLLQSRGHRKSRGIAEPQAAGVSHQHLYRPPVLPRDLFSANGTVCMAEGDSGEPAHNFQTGSRGIRRRAARCKAQDREPASGRAAELKPRFLPRKIARRELLLQMGECCASGAPNENALYYLQRSGLLAGAPDVSCEHASPRESGFPRIQATGSLGVEEAGCGGQS